MKDHGKVRSSVQPEKKVIDDYSVWIAENIKEVEKPPVDDQESPGTEWEYDLTQYSKDEYIALLAQKNEALETQIESTQEAIDFLLGM